MTTAYSRRSLHNKAGLVLGPLAALVLLLWPVSPEMIEVRNMGAIVLLMAIFWFTDAIPLSATALFPFILFPAFGILSAYETAPLYINSTIFLFIGGFLIAVAMEKWNLHRRIAIAIIARIGGVPERIVLGFLVASAFLSMWISNIATAIMLLPIGLSIISKLENEFGKTKTRALSVAIMLSIAYASSVGGMASLVGTPPNLAMKSVFETIFPEAPPISFGQWFTLGLPLSIVMLTIIWLLLTKVFYRTQAGVFVSPEQIEADRENLGPMRWEEKCVASIFAATAVLWMTRRDLDFGILTIPGWSGLSPLFEPLNDGVVAIAMALLLFVLPTRTPAAKEKAPVLLDAGSFSKLPWDVVILFGGGFALAHGFAITGLSDFLAGKLTMLQGVPTIVLILSICLGMTFATEFTSNTATSLVTLPILAGLSTTLDVNPLLLMLPATFSASCAFMMPVATPPNTVVFGSGRVRMSDFIRTGFALNIIGILIVTLAVYLIGIPVFGIETGVLPDWAVVSTP